MNLRLIGGIITKTLQLDSHGRLNLGKRYASSTFLFEVVDDEDLLLKKSRCDPRKRALAS